MMTMKTMLLVSAVAVLSFSCDEENTGNGSCAGQLVTILSVVDGDTIKAEELDKSIRLLGINAPETSGTNAEACPLQWENMSIDEQDEFREDCCYGEQAKVFLTNLLPPGTQVCLVNPEGGKPEQDIYQRTLADVYVGSTFVNAKLIVSGYARAYKDFPHPTKAEEFEQLEDKAQSILVGMWGYCAATSDTSK